MSVRKLVSTVKVHCHIRDTGDDDRGVDAVLAYYEDGAVGINCPHISIDTPDIPACNLCVYSQPGWEDE